MRLAALRHYLKSEATAGFCLMFAAALAIILANSPALSFYQAALAMKVGFHAGGVGLEKALILWINDGLMAVFFLLVGLEIKREIVVGQLSSIGRAALPAMAAVGGVAVPALIYFLFNMNDPETVRGWAIPAATDIAFAVGVLAILGSRVPGSLRIFLLALAIIDDLMAIVIIALFYTDGINPTALALAGVCLLVLAGMNWRGVRRIDPYLIVGAILWVCVLKSGIHATLAGVATAFAIPLLPGKDEVADDHYHSPLETLEHRLHPWVAYAIMPIFALANAGEPLDGVTLSHMFGTVPLGIAIGLFVGKQVGVFGFTWLAIRLGISRRPKGASWGQIYGIALLAGIGFTMSLFIGNLAFPSQEYAIDVRLGVLVGSLVSAIAGYVVLARLGKRRMIRLERAQASASAPASSVQPG